VAEGTGFTVTLDGKRLKTPAGSVIAVARREFAEALAAEWTGVLPRAKGAKVNLDRVPLTRIAGTVIDRLPSRRSAVIDELLAHAETELLCYRALEPRELARRQSAMWQPILDWLALAYDARLDTHTSMLPADQPPESLAALRRALEGFDDWKLGGLGLAVAASGSLAIGLALADGRLDAEGAFAAAELDSTYQIERWGEDPALAARHAAIRRDLTDAHGFFALART
jgi:chaperone required for assembly of F1-ATPase